MNGLKEIETRISELETIHEKEIDREKRLLDLMAGFYAEQEKIAPKGTASAHLEKMGLKLEDMQRLFKAEEGEAKKLVDRAIETLQPTESERELFIEQARAIALINPWLFTDAKCSFHAAFCRCIPWKTPQNASASCACNTSINECNPRVEASGVALLGYGGASTNNYCYFEIPRRPAATQVRVSVCVELHGFYVLTRGHTSPFNFALSTLSLDLEAKGFQYGQSWGGATQSALNLNGNAMGRIDEFRYLQFSMPTGADPFQVRVSATLKANARTAGSVALGDFATGAGNFIKIHWVNTYS
jgi:hypothetical protein